MDRHRNLFIAECIVYPLAIGIGIMCLYNPIRRSLLPANRIPSSPSKYEGDGKNTNQFPEALPIYIPSNFVFDTNSLFPIGLNLHNLER